MPALATDLHRQLENVVIQARDKAVEGARSALVKRAVDCAEPFPHFTATEKELRNRLRARGRQVGDLRTSNKTQSIERLTDELAYEYWHRMLFARFLAENHLLMHPDGVAVSLEECEELAKSEGSPNGFFLAARYASRMLPQVFRSDDVLLEIEFAPEHRLALERLLTSLPRETFLADDSLGWVYQFWQSLKKKEVNESGQKIDGLSLPAKTQLFTDDYMVQFLLHNTVGAWWCTKNSIKGVRGGAGIPAGKAPVQFTYLRWRDDGTPAAGLFDDWPTSFKEFTLLDPCCGSGHFLVSALNLLVPLRMHDDGLSAQDACDAVLRENLHGLELDPRCTQIAAFALALAAWKYPGENGDPLGYRVLPQLNIACSGQGVTGRLDEWLALANDDERLRDGMEKLFSLFKQAPHLGSLIDPRREKGNLIAAGFKELQPLLAKALASEAVQHNADAAAVGVAAQGIAKATELLSKDYQLIATNVPYLGRGDQAKVLLDFSEKEAYSTGKGDIATVFLLRCLDLATNGGFVAIVTPWNWLFLTTYDALRKKILSNFTIPVVARLGERAFESPQAAGAFAAMGILQRNRPTKGTVVLGLDVSSQITPSGKAAHLLTDPLEYATQEKLLSNPGYVITTKNIATVSLLGSSAQCYQGTSTGDNPRFILCFWELPAITGSWCRFQVAPERTEFFGGRRFLIRWKDVESFEGAAIRGTQAWDRPGIAIGQMRSLPATLYTGDKFSNTTPVIVPDNEADVGMVWHYCTSEEFFNALRDLNPKLSVDNGYVGKIGIDTAKWKQFADSFGPLPSPESDDPANWLFRGDILQSRSRLQVAVATLLGYRWPDQQSESDAADGHSVREGIVCIPAVRGERPASELLEEQLSSAYGELWSTDVLDKLLSETGCKPGTSLDDWLRNSFFQGHCEEFHNRPFVWHIWDGRKDGFSCLVNYHKLNHKTLENLTYSYLGDWIKTQTNDARIGKTGADLRLAAAQNLQEGLKLILAGDPPNDIFIRWKPLSQQPIGWNPDLNDGVRINIRPFLESSILRTTPNIKWTKDKGKELYLDSKHEFPWCWKDDQFTGDRLNDIHLTNAEKQAAKKQTKVSK